MLLTFFRQLSIGSLLIDSKKITTVLNQKSFQSKNFVAGVERVVAQL